MSARFAIPATTFVLKSVIEQDLKTAYGSANPPPVLVAPPPRPPAAPPPAAAGGAPAADREVSAVHLFMHHVAPNPGYRNMDVPYIEDDLSRSVRRPLVLDLHYLLAATGAGLERETLLGVAMTALHRRAILERADVFAILDGVTPPAGSTDPMDGMYDEPLWRQGQHPEAIKISQHALDIDMSTKLWSALQSPIRPSAYYLVTTTFLDAQDSKPEGPKVDEMNIAARPSANRMADPAGDLVLTRTTP